MFPSFRVRQSADEICAVVEPQQGFEPRLSNRVLWDINWVVLGREMECDLVRNQKREVECERCWRNMDRDCRENLSA